MRATFTGFDQYKLTGVTVTDQELGHGSYATVLQLDYMGLKCAGKKIHEVLLRQGDTSYTVRRFEEECRLLSQVRHPNIVQFIGVHFQEGVPAPILVMEFLHTNLTSCIEQYGILPKEISYSILYDVALGLCYLHRQTPPIIHRDLSSNNVLLTADMTAKISDLGVARILNLTPLQVSRMTQTPGTPAYMPPEVMIANNKHDTKVDVFSYGIMMIHMFSGRWPEPQVGQTRFEGDQLSPVTEAERREEFLRAIGNDHPLMDLILRCINNDPRRRAHACKIVERLSAMKLQFPSSFANRLEMLKQIEHQEEEKTTSCQGETESEEILTLRQREDKDLNLVLSSEVEQLKLQIQHVSSQHQSFIAKSEVDITEMKTKIAVYESQIATGDKTLQEEREQFENQLDKETELCRSLTVENQELQSEISHLGVVTNSLKHKHSILEAETSRKDATIERNEYELHIKTTALEESNAIISGMGEQIKRMREYLLSKHQVSTACSRL